jgi:hypothetical protein
MTSWLFSGWFQKSGSEICCSVVANSARLAGASKIAPHSVGLLAERNVFSFQFFQSHRGTILAGSSGSYRTATVMERAQKTAIAHRRIVARRARSTETQ